ncbi:MAG: NUDIX pyrophosphatase [Ignavibacteriaceae bacterium]|nr:NUDIX pyrophosphatase [Ignavibacteriaceae bacterium]
MNVKSDMVEIHICRYSEDHHSFLVLKRAETENYPNLWQPVTGRVHENESAIQGAMREIKEETGLMPKKLWVVPQVNTFFSPLTDSVNLIPVFLALVDEREEVKLSEEHSEYQWLSYNEAIPLFAWPGQRKSLESIHEYLNEKSNFFELIRVEI